MLTLPQLGSLLPAKSFKKDLAISGFFPVLHLWRSEDCLACPLHCGVQSAALAKVSLQDPFPCNSYVRTRMSNCSLLLPVNCLSAISRLLQKGKKICWCELALDKNLQSGIKNRCGSGVQASCRLSSFCQAWDIFPLEASTALTVRIPIHSKCRQRISVDVTGHLVRGFS